MIRPVRLLAWSMALLLMVGLAQPVLADEDDDDSGRSGKGPKFGAFREVPAHGVRGDYVSFSWEPNGLRNFTVNGTKLFDVDAPAGAGEASARLVGSVIKVDGATYDLQAHDNPMAVVKFDAEGRTTLRLASGAVATQLADHVLVEYGSVSARLFNAENVKINGGTITVDNGFRFLLEEPLAHFDDERPKLAKAAAEKKIGAEISLGKGKRHDVVSFGNVSAEVVRTPDAPGRDLLVRVAGHGFDGRVIVMNVDGELFGAFKADDLRIEYDNTSIGPAASLTDVLDPDDDGLAPEYWLGYDVASDGFQLVVSVPHYSVHDIRVASLLAEAPPSVVIGIVAGVVAVAASAFVMFRPRRAE